MRITARATPSGKGWFRCPACPGMVEKGSVMEVIHHANQIARDHERMVRDYFAQKEAEEKDAEDDDDDEEDDDAPPAAGEQ